MDQQALRLLIRSKLQNGRLPLNSVPRVWGGRGNGEKCVACEATIAKEQLAMEGISLAAGGGIPIILHVECFQLWDHERRELPK
jgi:hypothetical protein